jgi:hypothetical protein
VISFSFHGKIKNACKVWLSFTKKGRIERHRSGWKDTIKMYLIVIESGLMWLRIGSYWLL